ncbi:MAG: hypothetical protein KIT43_12565 [Bauldia sp.]|nr:hypothetical protein [Bauldia sp.]
MDSFAALPPWAIIAVFALIAGAAGGSGTYFLRKRYPTAGVLRYLPIMAVLAGAALGTLIALPTIRANATPVSCESAQSMAERANDVAAGEQVNETVRAIGMIADCGLMEIVFELAVSLDLAGVTPEELAVATRSVSDELCRQGPLRRYIDAGWTLRNLYTFEDGGTHTITAECAPAG